MTTAEPLAPDLSAALTARPEAQQAFEGLAPSCRREYLSWIDEAKRPETRARRIAQTLEKLAG